MTPWWGTVADCHSLFRRCLCGFILVLHGGTGSIIRKLKVIVLVSWSSQIGANTEEFHAPWSPQPVFRLTDWGHGFFDQPLYRRFKSAVNDDALHALSVSDGNSPDPCRYCVFSAVKKAFMMIHLSLIAASKPAFDRICTIWLLERLKSAAQYWSFHRWYFALRKRWAVPCLELRTRGPWAKP